MKILLTGAYKYTECQLSRLKALGADFLYVEDEREELSFDVSAVDAVVCNGLFLYNDIKKFKNLKFIQLTSAGLDRVKIFPFSTQGGFTVCRWRNLPFSVLC